jgi:hypothetical protein
MSPYLRERQSVRYVRNGDGRLAFRIYGDAEATLVWVPTMMSSIDRYDDPAFPWGAAVEQLAREMRVVVWDGRGTGLSDPVVNPPTLEERVRDLVSFSAPPRWSGRTLRRLHRRNALHCARRDEPGQGAIADPLRNGGTIHTGPSGFSVGLHT